MPAMTLQDIKETKRYGRTEGRTGNVKAVYPMWLWRGGVRVKKINYIEYILIRFDKILISYK